MESLPFIQSAGVVSSSECKSSFAAMHALATTSSRNDSPSNVPHRATANNGRRKELQQHFVLHLKVFGTLPDNSKVVLTESITAPIVVRGRSPRNFQARKEIPLLGSSAGSRGQALVETGLGVVASAISLNKDGKARSVDMQVPRSSFTFSPPKSHNSSISTMRSK